MNKMDKILLLVFITAAVFIIAVLALAWTDHSVPESFCCAVIGALCGECGVMGWIKTIKEKQSDQRREDYLHDRDRAEEKEEKDV